MARLEKSYKTGRLTKDKINKRGYNKFLEISKGNLEMRPVFHFTERRIEAHVCICFIAYKVYKELERIIRISRINLSVDKVLDIAKTIATIDIKPLFDLKGLLGD